MTEADLLKTLSERTQREVEEVVELLKAGKREYLHIISGPIVEMYVGDPGVAFDGTQPVYLIGIVMMAYRRLAGLDQNEVGNG